MSLDKEQTEERGIEQREVETRQTRTWLLVMAAVALLAILAGNRPAAPAQESFALAGIDRINVNSRAARVIISPGATGNVGVDLDRNTRGHELAVSQDGRTLNVSVTRRTWPPAFLMFNRAAVEITVPATAALDIDVDVRSGGVEASHVALGSAEFTSRSGGISVDEVTAGGDLALSTASGGIRVSGTTVNGQLRAETSSGGVNLSEVTASDYRLGARSGRISATGLTGGPLVADARSGGISLSAATLLGDWQLSTGSGGIAVNLDAAPQAMRLQYSGGSGSWSVADSYGLEVSETGRNSVTASKGSGGPLLQVRTGSGSFRLR